MNFRNLLLVAACVAQLPAFGQPAIGRFVSIGVTAGGSLTDAFSDRTVTVPGLNGSPHYFSGSKDYIVGPMLEVHLPANLSVEFDALYRPLNLTTAVSVTVAPGFTSSARVNTWEFPLLAKYRLSTPVIKPFLEAGPSFRHVSLFSGDSPHLSQAGFTAGIGVGFKLMRLRIDPEIRYTRWGSDAKPSPYLFDPRSNVNQAELLLGLSF